jgi:hypothetical protein
MANPADQPLETTAAAAAPVLPTPEPSPKQRRVSFLGTDLILKNDLRVFPMITTTLGLYTAALALSPTLFGVLFVFPVLLLGLAFDKTSSCKVLWREDPKETYHLELVVTRLRDCFSFPWMTMRLGIYIVILSTSPLLFGLLFVIPVLVVGLFLDFTDTNSIVRL